MSVQTNSSRELVIQRSGDLVHIPEQIDLTVRACKAFYAHANIGMGYAVTIHVDKQVPEQAGLGGGSSNAATVLRLLQQHHQNPIEPEQLAAIGLTLGADVPFFLQDSSAFVEGIGEAITPIQGISGHLIFSDPQLTRNSSDVKIAVFDSARRMNSELMACLQANTQNALQAVVSRNYPEWEQQFGVFSNCVAKLNPQLIRMSGSGSAMFALFASPSQLSTAVAAVADAPELQRGQLFECKIKPS